MSQILTLLWLKWKLTLSQLSTPRALLGQLLFWAFGLLIFCMSVLSAVGIFLTLSMLSVGGVSRLSGMTLNAMILLYSSSFFVIWLMTAVVPARPGGEFETEYLLQYPFSLRRLFWLDLGTELLKGVSLILLPPMAALWLSVPFLYHRLAWGIPPLLLSLLLGGLLVRTLELLFSQLGGKGRSASENAAAIGGLVMVGLILAGSLLGTRFVRIVELDQGWLGQLARQLPNALALKLIVAARAGDLPTYLWALARFALFPLLLLPLTWRLWMLRTLGRRSAGIRAGVGKAGLPWRVPFCSDRFSALIEKEARYLMRNSQVKVLLMLGLLILLFQYGMRLPEFSKGGAEEQWLRELILDLKWMRGLDWLIMMVYAALFYFGLFCNAFGLEGHGFKQVLLTPVAPRQVLLAKHLTLAALLLLQWVTLWVASWLVFGNADWEGLLVSLGLVATILPLMSGLGGLMSIYLPERGVFGSKLSTSPWAVLLLVPELPLIFGPAALGFYLGRQWELIWVKHAVLLGWATLSWALYAWILLPRCTQALEQRAQRMLETLTAADEG